MLRHVCGIAGGLGMMVLLSAAVAGDESKVTKKQLQEFLEIGWTNSPESRLAADEAYADLAAKTRSDSRVMYANALVKIKQIRYAEASKAVDALLEYEKEDVHAWRMRVWIDVLTKNYTQALKNLDKLAQVLPDDEDQATDEQEVYLEVAGFMGRVFGFLEGPVASSSAETLRTTQRKKVLARLGPNGTEAFHEGRDAVTDKFLVLTDQHSVVRERAKADADEEKGQKLKDLNEAREEIGKRTDKLQDHSEKVKSEFKSQIEDLERKDRPLADRQNRLETQAALLRRDIATITADIGRLELLLDNEKDPIIRDNYFRQIDRLNVAGIRSDNELRGVLREGQEVTARRADLQRQGLAAESDAGRQIDRAEKERNELQRKANKALAQEKRLKKSQSVGDTPEIQARSAQAKSFISYEPYPLELDRQRLLDATP